MNIEIKTMFIGVFIGLYILLLSPLVYAIGIGIAPTETNITNATRGGEYERSITIFNPSDDASNFTFDVEGEIKEWVSFYSIADLTKSTNKTSIGSRGKESILMKIKIPEDASSTIYNAYINVATVPPEVGDVQQGVAARLSSRAKITIEVTGDQIIDGIVKAITVDNTEPGFPLRISTIFQNTGNVVTKPKISVVILQGENNISNFANEDIRVKPEVAETIISEWNTTASNVIGDYNASVSVSLDGKELRSENLQFKILPIGTLSRKGNLTEIVIDGKPELGTTLKVKGHFQNTGQIDTLAKFNAEIYANNKLVDNIVSDELEVKKGEDVFLTSYLKIASPGEYNIKGKVTYSGKSTDVKEYSFKMPSKGIPGFGSIVTIVLIITTVIIIRYRTKKLMDNGR